MTAGLAIVREAALELALMVDEATRRQLRFAASEPVAVSYSGGVFDNVGALLLEPFTASLQAFHPGYRICEPVLPPAMARRYTLRNDTGSPIECGH